MNKILFLLLVVVAFGACSKNEEDEIAPEYLSFLEDTVNVKIGEGFVLTYELSTTVVGEYDVIFEFRNPEIVSYRVYDYERFFAKNVGSAIVVGYVKQRPDLRDSCIVNVLPICETMISISKSTMEMYVGDDSLLVASVYPNDATYKEIKWSSSDERVAVVNNGMVKALSPGEVNIYAESHGGMKATCKIVVDPRQLEFDKSEIEMFVGDKSVLTVNNAIDWNLKWSSSDETVAIVNNGTVSAIAPGSAEVYAEAENAVKAVCKVTVKERLVTNVQINELEDGQTILLGDKFGISFGIEPENAANKNVEVFSSDNSIVEIDANNVLHAKSKGSAIVTIASKDGNARREYHVTVGDITSFMTFSTSGSFSNIMGYFTGQLTCSLVNKSAHTINVTSIQVFNGYGTLQLTATSGLGSVSSGNRSSLGINMNRTYYPRFVWTIEFEGNNYQLVYDTKDK